MMDSNLLKRSYQGVVGNLAINPVQYTILAACSALAWAYTFELNLLVLYTFRRRKGLYFWSLLISSWGCTLHALGFILKFLVDSSPGSFLPFIEVGWVAMVTGQSFVLFSRLHLVVRNRRTLRLVLCMIIFDAFALHTPTICFTIGSNTGNAAFWVPKFNIMERIQLTIFCVQESTISAIYILSTVRLLGSIYHSMTRKVMFQLVLINAICISMDIVLIGLEFAGNYIGETSAKPLIYAIKLRLEFVVLNQLMGLTKAGFAEEHQFQGQGGAHMHPQRSHLSGTMNSTSSPEPGNEKTAAKSASGWASSRNMKDSLSPNPLASPEHIYQTKKVEVLSQPKSPGPVADSGDSSSVSSESISLGTVLATPHPPPQPASAGSGKLNGRVPVIPRHPKAAHHQDTEEQAQRPYEPQRLDSQLDPVPMSKSTKINSLTGQNIV